MELQIEHGIPIPPHYHQRGRKPRPEGACKCGRTPRFGYATCDICLERSRVAYQSRRAENLCGWGTSCSKPAEDGHSMCREHLDRSRSSITAMLDGRIARGVCRQCGDLPRVLGDAAYCILCRQKNRKGESPIPRKMRMIIRQFWRLDRIDQRRARAEDALPYIKNVRTRQIVKMRHGLNDGIDHTLEEIGNALGVTRERVRQLETKVLRELKYFGLDVTILRPPFGDVQRLPNRHRDKEIPESEQKKMRAHRAVSSAISSGMLQRGPCAKCGRSDAIAHHHDYDKPLDVEWLCRPHHMETHGRGKGYKSKHFKSNKGIPYGPQSAAWWLKRAQPDDRHYAASEIVAALRQHNVKQKEVIAATGLHSSTINLIVNGKQVSDKHLITMLRYAETIKTDSPSM